MKFSAPPGRFLLPKWKMCGILFPNPRKEETDMTLFEGRPADCAGRLDKEIRTYDFLDGLGVQYQRIDHAPAMTMEVCADIDAALEATICKNLLLCNRQCTVFYLLMIPGRSISRPRSCPTRSAPPGCPLRRRSIWSGFWTLLPVRSACWV